MLHAIEFLAVLSAALFAGAALYINLVEHPARMVLATDAALAQWAPSYARATWMQAPLALVSLLCGIGAAWQGGGIVWAIPAILIGAVIPFTFVVIMPTNRRLLAAASTRTDAETRALLDRWAQLHGVRTVLSCITTILYLYAALGA